MSDVSILFFKLILDALKVSRTFHDPDDADVRKDDQSFVDAAIEFGDSVLVNHESPGDVAIRQLRYAKEALVKTGFFKEDELGNNIAGRITEMADRFREYLCDVNRSKP